MAEKEIYPPPQKQKKVETSQTAALRTSARRSLEMAGARQRCYEQKKERQKEHVKNRIILSVDISDSVPEQPCVYYVSVSA